MAAAGNNVVGYRYKAWRSANVMAATEDEVEEVRGAIKGLFISLDEDGQQITTDSEFGETWFAMQVSATGWTHASRGGGHTR
jgi:hypothetical protein